MSEKMLDISEEKGAKANISDLKVYGDTDTFALLCKASSQDQGWMKSTKVCNLPNGCIVQVTTQQKNPDGSYAVAEALTFVPDINMDKSVDPRKLVQIGIIK
jgi:pyruvate/2-oxoglutarate dehydrogenase complex dihydrolipoamide acyltransferase (E2) component